MITERLRLQIWDRQAGLCMCGKPATEIHHLIKRSQGGKDNIENLEARCWECHHTLNGKTMGHRR